MIFLVYSLHKFILIYLQILLKYIFLTQLRVKDFFYKILNLFSQYANKWQSNNSLSKYAVMT